MELCTLLSRVAIERGANTDSVLQMNTQLIQDIMSAENVYDVCYIFQDNINIFTEGLFYNADKDHQIVRRVAEYMVAHFSENLTLNSLAEMFHVNASYLSSLFKQVTNLTFKEYLNQIRIEEAKRLLSSTDYSIIDIAVACGYNDQSYFTKLFKKYTGLTPKHYR